MDRSCSKTRHHVLPGIGAQRMQQVARTARGGAKGCLTNLGDECMVAYTKRENESRMNADMPIARRHRYARQRFFMPLCGQALCTAARSGLTVPHSFRSLSLVENKTLLCALFVVWCGCHATADHASALPLPCWPLHATWK